MKLHQKILRVIAPEDEKLRMEQRKSLAKRQAYVEDLDRTLTQEEMAEWLRQAGVFPKK